MFLCHVNEELDSWHTPPKPHTDGSPGVGLAFSSGLEACGVRGGAATELVPMRLFPSRSTRGQHFNRLRVPGPGEGSFHYLQQKACRTDYSAQELQKPGEDAF